MWRIYFFHLLERLDNQCWIILEKVCGKIQLCGLIGLHAVLWEQQGNFTKSHFTHIFQYVKEKKRFGFPNVNLYSSCLCRFCVILHFAWRLRWSHKESPFPKLATWLFTVLQSICSKGSKRRMSWGRTALQSLGPRSTVEKLKEGVNRHAFIADMLLEAGQQFVFCKT